MKTIFRLKWELIIAIAFGLVTILGWSVWGTEQHDWRLLLLVLIPTIAFIVWIVAYPTIKEFRHQVLKLWQ